MNTELLTEHHLEFLSLTGDCTGSSESTLVKMPHCWKSHVAAHIEMLAVILMIPGKVLHITYVSVVISITGPAWPKLKQKQLLSLETNSIYRFDFCIP